MNPYGNPTRQIPGISNEVVAIAADRLMPPQYDEFCAALSGSPISDITRKYWQNVAATWDEMLEDL